MYRAGNVEGNVSGRITKAEYTTEILSGLQWHQNICTYTFLTFYKYIDQTHSKRSKKQFLLTKTDFFKRSGRISKQDHIRSEEVCSNKKY